MKKDKFRFLIVGLVGVLFVGIFALGVANASNSLIYISPNALDKQVGDSFNLSVIVDTAGSKVCAVEGELQLDNKLTCQSISLEEGIMAQKQPSCADPSFLLGIPSCTVDDKTLFTVAVKGAKVGTAVASFNEVDVIGEGLSLSNTSVNGNYTLSAVPTVTIPTDVPVVPVVVPAENCVCEDWGDWQRNDCGAGDCESTQLSQTRVRTCSPDNCEVTVENRCVVDAYCASAIPPVEEDNIFQGASVIDAVGSIGTGWLIGILILLIAIVIFFLSKKKRR